MITGFYSAFPNGDAVGERIYRINNMPWLSAEALNGNEDAVRRHVAEHIERLQMFYAGDAGTNTRVTRIYAKLATVGAAVDAAWDAAYETVSDLLTGKKNPWDPLLDVYELGYLLRFEPVRILTRQGEYELKL